MEEGAVEFRRPRRSLFTQRGSVEKLIQRGPLAFACAIGRGRCLKIERADAVRARLKKKGQFVQASGVGLLTLCTKLPIENDAPTPGVRSGIADAVRHVKPGEQRKNAAAKRQFG